MVFTLGKSNITYNDIFYNLHAGFVNQLMACYWMDQGIEVESIEHQRERTESILEKLNKARKRKRIKFTF